MKALLGRKIGMSQVFSPEGAVIPVTLVQAEPNLVVGRRTEKKDGHDAVQLMLPRQKKGREHTGPTREFALEVAPEEKQVTVEQFVPGDMVTVAGVSKGKGYQGVVKRHHFKGGPASHGHRHVLRSAGSIGSRFPQHTRKGRRMAGRMGGDRVTVKNLVVVAVDPERRVLAIKGAVPGTRDSLVEIRSAAAKK